MHVVYQEQLPFSVIARELEGAEHGGVDVSPIFVDAPPGRGHDDAEVWRRPLCARSTST